VTKAVLAVVFVAWVFIIGVLVGRGSFGPLYKDSSAPATSGAAPMALYAQPDEAYAPALSQAPALFDADASPSPGIVGETYADENADESAASARDARLPLPEPLVATATPEPWVATSAPEPLVATSAPEPPPTTVSPRPSPSAALAADGGSLPAAAEETRYWPNPPRGEGAYAVQIAAPADEAEARSLTEKYRLLGFEAYYYEKSPTRFPVRVGRFDQKDEADAVKIRLESAGAKDPYVSKLNG
jgi:cell division septation protein DedD